MKFKAKTLLISKVCAMKYIDPPFSLSVGIGVRFRPSQYLPPQIYC